jgi:hypothetical protein
MGEATARRTRLSLGATISALVIAGAAATPGPARAGTVASVTVGAGTLSFISGTPSTAITFPSTTLNGTSQTITATLAFSIGDATGSGAGWNVTATSTTFTSGSHTLPTTATTVQTAPTPTCNSATTCTPATNLVTFPYTLPAAATAPTATKLFDSAANTGLGDQTFTPTWTLMIPAGAVASATPYASTWTFSLVSGP